MPWRGGIQELAEREGFIVVCPEGIENNWNDGRVNERNRAHIEDIDDVGFLRALIQQLGMTHNVDPDRIYVTGASNGGMMSLRNGLRGQRRLSCRRSSDRLAAGRSQLRAGASNPNPGDERD